MASNLKEFHHQITSDTINEVTGIGIWYLVFGLVLGQVFILVFNSMLNHVECLPFDKHNHNGKDYYITNFTGEFWVEINQI